MQEMNRGKHVRWVRVAVVAVVWIVFSATFVSQWSGDARVWERVFGVPPMAGPFADLSQIAAAVQSAQHGLDPYVLNPYDMGRRPFIYPRVWLYGFSALRITPARIEGAGITVAGCFLLTVSWLIVRQADVWAAVLVGTAACSSATAFAIERGNTDLLIFCLVVLAAELPGRDGGWGGWWLLVAAAVLKVYPIFALVGASIAGRKTRLLLLALVVAAGGVLFQHKQVSQDQSLPHGYGFKEIDVAMGKAPEAWRSSFAAHALAFRVVWDSMLALLCCSGVAVGVIHGRKRAPAAARQSEVQGSTSGGMVSGSYGFVLCASIFVGTFLLSTNYDYRLIFLLPMLPFLVWQARNGLDKFTCRLGAAGLVLAFAGFYRGMAGHIPWLRLALVVKAVSHVDLWVLLWTVCFFLGLIAIKQDGADGGPTESGAGNSLQVGLIKESA